MFQKGTGTRFKYKAAVQCLFPGWYCQRHFEVYFVFDATGKRLTAGYKTAERAWIEAFSEFVEDDINETLSGKTCLLLLEEDFEPVSFTPEQEDLGVFKSFMWLWVRVDLICPLNKGSKYIFASITISKKPKGVFLLKHNDSIEEFWAFIDRHK